MSLGDDATASPQFTEVTETDDELGAMVLLKLGKLRVSLSFVVPLAAAILIITVAVATWLPGGTSDLPPSAAAASAFWISGWAAQVSAFLVLHWAFGRPSRRLRLGLLGVEVTPPFGSARRATIVGVGTVLPVVVLATFYRWVEGGFRFPELAPIESSTWVPPSVGLKDHESIWRTGAWLCWIQVILQMLPFPRTPGRLLLASLVVGVGGQLPQLIQYRLMRQLLVLLSIVLIAVSLPLLGSDDPALSSKWPLVFVAALLLWGSSRRRDVQTMIASMQKHDPTTQQRITNNWWAEIRDGLEQRKQRKRVRQAVARERAEASDAKRLDEILNRLHRDGGESLSPDDRRILDRVSKNLRQQRSEKTPEEQTPDN